MAGCDIAIKFDRDGAYRGGEVVRGEVIVRATDDVPCNGLVLHRYWRTAGKGSTDTGPRVTATLFRGQWVAGETYRYPFHFTAPAAPLSYRGRTMRIDHYVEARADVPWSFDPKAREPFYVEPGGEGGPNELGRTVGAEPDIDLAQITQGNGKMVAGIVCLIVGVFIPFIGIFLVPVGIGIIIWSAFVMHARKKIGEVEVRVPDTVSPGGVVPVHLSFTPTADATINRITARLIGSERCTSGSGKSRKTHRAEIFNEAFVLSAGGAAAPGRPVTVRGDVPVPTNAAYSLNASNNKIIWRIDLCIDIANWPDWRQRHMLRVLPGIGRSTAARPAPPAPRSDSLLEDTGEHVHVRGSTRSRTEPLAEPTLPAHESPEPLPDRAPTVTADWGSMPELPSLTDPEPAAAATPSASDIADANPMPKAPTLDALQGVPDAGAVQDAPDAATVQSVPSLGFDVERAVGALDVPDDPRTNDVDAPDLGELHVSAPRSAASILGLDEDDTETIGAADGPDRSDASKFGGPLTPPSPAGGEGSEPADSVAGGDDNTNDESDAEGGLADAIATIVGADRFSGARDKVIEALTGRLMPVSIKVLKTEWTTSMSSGEGYRSGRTVVGALPNGHEVALRLKDTATDLAESLDSGDTLTAIGRIVEWNSLYDRPELEVDEVN